MPESESFQHYQVLRQPDGSLWELGRGAMGVTYKAFDTNLRCNVALKVINAQHLDSEMARQRFLREARAAAGLSHPNVASVFHLGESGGNYFYAMEFIKGETLEAFVRRCGSLPPVVALRIALQVARALRAASREGLVHRDIKPANLMLLREDDDDNDPSNDDDDLHLKVIDFGLAKATHKEGVASITMSGFVGTPHFASPEQLEEKDLDVRSDIYSLGITLWYMLVGKPPFTGGTMKIMSQQLTSPPPFEQLANVPAPVVRLLEHLLEKDRDRRPQNASDLRREIEQAIRELGADVGASAVTEHTGSSAASAKSLQSTDAAPAVGQVRTAEPSGSDTVLAGRFQLLREVESGGSGTLYEARDLAGQRTVAVRFLKAEVTASPTLLQKLETAVRQARSVAHPGWTRVESLENAQGRIFLVHEWVDGPRVIDLLRRGVPMSLPEALRILEPLAAAADAATQVGLHDLDFDPAQVTLALDAAAADGRERLLGMPLTTWPAFQPKVLPLTLAHSSANAVTWTGEQTMTGDHGEPAVGDACARLAILAYELLGGRTTGTSRKHSPPPLPALSEHGNTVLREAMTGIRNATNASVTGFIATLRANDSLSAPQGNAVHATPSPASRVADARAASSVVAPPERRSPPPPPPPPAAVGTSGGNITVWIIAGGLFFILLALGGVVTYWAVGHSPAPTKPPREPLAAASPTPIASPEIARVTPPSAPSPSPSAQTTAPPETSASPEASMGPSITVPPTPAPTPDRESRVQEIVADLQRLEANGDIVAALDGWARLVQEYPEYGPGLTRLEAVVHSLRARSSPDAGQPSLQTLRAPLERAAGVGSDAAMLALGDRLLASEPATAAEWYRKAADRGELEAMLDLGNLYFRGTGVAQDLAQATHWYQLAADKGSVRAKINLAEFYEQGRGGLPHDYAKMLALLNEADAAEPNNPITTEKLALSYEHGWGTKSDPKKAMDYMKRAADAGNLNALGNLGVYYMRGVGGKADPRTAVGLFKQGADKNNGACLFFYAQCLEKGIGGLTADSAAAKEYYRNSASRGFALARQWCSQHNVGYAPNN